MVQKQKPDVPKETWVMAQDIYLLALTDPDIDGSSEASVIQYSTDKAKELCLNEDIIKRCVEYMHPFQPSMQQANMLIDQWIDELYSEDNPPVEELGYSPEPPREGME